MSDQRTRLTGQPIRIYDTRREEYRDAVQSDLDLALDRVLAFSQYRNEVQALTDELEERLRLITRKYAS